MLFTFASLFGFTYFLSLSVLLFSFPTKSKASPAAVLPRHVSHHPHNRNPLVGHDKRSYASPAHHGSGIFTSPSTTELHRQNAFSNHPRLGYSFQTLIDATECGLNRTCIDGSCCSPAGQCGYGKDICGTGCTSNCDATASCGINSKGGNVSCPLNVCCSQYGYCGATKDFCTITGSASNSTGCQIGFGSCNTTAAPTCDQNKKSASKGRNVQYYQFQNEEYRLCNRINTSSIYTKNVTHLYLAFAPFDPANFTVGSTLQSDQDRYKNFTALKKDGLQTWIAIGGWEFSSPGTPTATAWSDMVASKENRTAFIESCVHFMKDYGFQGIDLDWEYPGSPDRGGRPKDTENFVSLLSEMRQAWNETYGISATIPLDFGALKYFDLKALEPYVDTFGVMSYDMQAGPNMRFHTDIRTIDTGLLPFWTAGVNASKLNFGLANYGRGYSIASKNCTQPGCAYSGLSQGGPCTNSSGLMTFTEIQNIIAKYRPNITLVKEALTKYITWEDQWMGYDDDQTMDTKRGWADKHCFGGAMSWSVDFKTGQGY